MPLHVIAAPCSCPDIRTGTGVETIQRAFLENLFYIQGRSLSNATANDRYMALAYTVRDRLLQRWLTSIETYAARDIRVLCYLSAEFLPGPHLGNAMLNLGIDQAVRQAVQGLELDLEHLLAQEEEPGLGNGGLGRLASCFLDSLATLEIPAIGYGIRYEFGIFDQEIVDGWQVERSDKWLHAGNPWEISRPEVVYEVPFGGRTEGYHDEQGRYRVRWHPNMVVLGVARDTPIPGYRTNSVNLLRLWKAEAPQSFDFQAFNLGDYYGAVEAKMTAENLSKVLYPNDRLMAGKKLRLMQQFFFVTCSLQDILHLCLLMDGSLVRLPAWFAIQLNDTHPSLAIAELMRLLVDQHHFAWDEAWDMCQRCFGYTNHTLLPEALEKWPVPLLAETLPRHLEIIHEINRRFLDLVRLRYPGDNDRIARMSLIEEGTPQKVRMAHLAVVGSQAVNGVAEMHSQLLRSLLLRDFHEMFPERFHNITNGVTPRRWLALANPRLCHLIDARIGEGWRHDLSALRQLEPSADDKGFLDTWRQIKHRNKEKLARHILRTTGQRVDPASLFDIQVKRIHEYKRQHLNVLHIITLYCRLKHQPGLGVPPRTCIFGGKAAPGYAMAKLIIRLITAVGETLQRDSAVRDRLQVVFLPDFNVSLGQTAYPAADLSEQISTAGKEASGTGNMKFGLNGAVTIGTLDGANVEILREVGADNIFLFGHKVDELQAMRRHYQPYAIYQQQAELREALDLIRQGFFSHGDGEMFRPLVEALLQQDDYFLLADYHSYMQGQERVSQAFADEGRWTRMSLLNTARMGYFSSDRSIREYNERIWHVPPVRIPDNGHGRNGNPGLNGKERR
ncbi:MAG: glycogen phosphorylase [Desulfobulbaceae bacterium A2]|nr:MAG: glycogen phosphorylase [Desulfobulbaceae bacterium A2]